MATDSRQYLGREIQNHHLHPIKHRPHHRKHPPGIYATTFKLSLLIIAITTLAWLIQQLLG